MANNPDSMALAPFLIRKTAQETHDTFTLELEPGGSRPFAFAAGQFNMLYVFGVGEVPISISGDPTVPQPLIHTIRAVGTVSKAMQKLKKGDALGMRGPFGTPWPLESAKGKDVVLVTGGIGLAPLRPVIYHILASRTDYGKVTLLYGARTPQDLLYPKELEQWRGRFDMEVDITVDRATDIWLGNVGVVTRLIPRANFDPQNSVAMVCGPEIMMRYAIMDLERSGMSGKNIYVSMERNMKCGVGLCGHCQCGPSFVCKDGPVYAYESIRDWIRKREI
jgi:NAD(P)H-flavin reductase